MDAHSIKMILIIAVIVYGCRCLTRELMEREFINAGLVVSVGATLILFIDNLLEG